MKKFIPLIVFILVIIGGYQVYLKYSSPQKETEPTEQQQLTQPNSESETVNNQKTSVESLNMQPKSKSPPEMTIDETKTYEATLKTSTGDITIELYAKATPITVNNFVSLARQGFYDGVIFHRVIKGFMIQGGDPNGSGTGGPGYKFDDEPFTGEYTRGTVAMANSGPNTNGSQFFIMHADTPLPKNYVIFGKVTDGMDTVDKIAEAPTKANDYPLNPVTINSVEIIEN